MHRSISSCSVLVAILYICWWGKIWAEKNRAMVLVYPLFFSKLFHLYPRQSPRVRIVSHLVEIIPLNGESRIAVDMHDGHNDADFTLPITSAALALNQITNLKLRNPCHFIYYSLLVALRHWGLHPRPCRRALQ